MANKKDKNKSKSKEVKEPDIVTENFETFEEKFNVKDFEEKKVYLVNLEKKLKNQETNLQKEQIKFEDKVNSINSKEIEIDANLQGLTEEIARLKQDKLNQLDIELSKLRITMLEGMTEDLTKERKIKIDSLDKEVAMKMEKMAVEKENLYKEKADFIDEKNEFLLEKRTLELERRILEEDQLYQKEYVENQINIKIDEERKTHNLILENKDTQLQSLRSNINNYSREIETYKSVLAELGEDPIIILNNINHLKEENVILKDELSIRPNEELKQDYEILEKQLLKKDSKYEQLKVLYTNLKEEFESNDHYKFLYEKADRDYIHEQSRAEEYKVQMLSFKSTVERLTANDGINIDRDALVKDISVPYIKFDNDENIYIETMPQPTSEIEWLNDIEDKCKEYEIIIPRRLLYAFHTALKISDWSQIAVLAGVSGTGKSELPKLYSAFGGINFISVAVQPNWNAPEDMLGFFNRIDNSFDPTELLRFLVQSTTQLKDYMSIILLDEMNLAHVENYFSDFLSKLEERRGLKNKELPSIELKLGAKVESFMLKLRRNLLWAGTMNQDETTKSLSDKVIDRGVIINFPRPSNFKRRTEMKSLNDYKVTNLLKYKTWAGSSTDDGWVKRKIDFSQEQMKEIDRFKEITEKINKYLENVGCALGHRIWNQIEFYIANYPTVCSIVAIDEDLTEELKKELHIAFEDMIVQKIMPKLRGVEVTVKSCENCFDKIQKLLENEGFNLTKDFVYACESNHGAFNWSSSSYIEEGLSYEE